MWLSRERLAELGLDSLEKRSLKNNPVAAWNFLKYIYKDIEGDLYSVEADGKMRDMMAQIVIWGWTVERNFSLQEPNQHWKRLPTEVV